MKIKKFLLLLISIIYIAGCSTKINDYKVNDKIKVNGSIENEILYEDGKEVKKNIFSLDEPITIDGVSVSKIQIDYDKELKEGSNISIEGTIIEQSPDFNISFGIAVNDIEDESLIKNTFSNKDFTITIPTRLIKLCTVKEIENGFIIFSTKDYEVGGEVFRVLSISTSEFKSLQSNEKAYIEKVASDQEKTIIIKYTNDSKEYSEEYETIGNSIMDIKRNITIK